MSDIKITRNSSILELQFDRAKKKNALTSAMYLALVDALVEANQDASVRAVILSGDGDVFCAGNDIQDFLGSAGMDASEAPPICFLEALVAFDKPILAAVHGAAVGIGTTMLLHTDLIYASETARFSVPFVSLGLVPEAASSLLLPRRVGHAVASDLLLRGAVLDATRAAHLGLVNEVVAQGELMALVRARADELTKLPPSALRATKALIRGDRDEVLARIRDEAKIFAAAVASDEAREAFSAFLERRPADFSKFSLRVVHDLPALRIDGASSRGFAEG